MIKTLRYNILEKQLDIQRKHSLESKAKISTHLKEFYKNKKLNK